MEKVIALEKLGAQVVEVILVKLLASVDAEFEAVGVTRCWYGVWPGAIVVAPSFPIASS